MDLIVGGAYQGKLDYAKNELGVTEEDVFCCTVSSEIDVTKRCYNHFEKFILGCIKEGSDKYKKLDLTDKIVISDDIFCGVVPIDDTERFWREETGRTLCDFSARSDSVTRLFCGIPRKLK